MQPQTLAARRRLYLLARVIVTRHYRSRLTLAAVARALSSSPRQVQRAYAQFGEMGFQEDLLARRMSVAAQLLAEQPAIAVRDVARLVGYRQAPHFAAAFRRRYGLPPARFRERARAHRAHAAAHGGTSQPALARPAGDERRGGPQTAVRCGAVGAPSSARAGASARGSAAASSAAGVSAVGVSAARGSIGPAAGGSIRSAPGGAIGSAPGRRTRMSVPPSGAGSAATRPPC